MNILNDIFSKEKQVDNNAAAPIPERLRKSERVLIITGDKAQDMEFFYPYYRFSEAGYEVDVATIKGGAFECKNGEQLRDSKPIGEVRAADYALLYLPGGKAPAELRKDEQVLRVVKEFAMSNKPIAAICHGAQILASAEVIRGKQISAWPEIKDEVEKAGATFVDEALVEDGQFITARKPGDLPRHLFGVMQYLEGKPMESRDNRRFVGASA